MTTLNIKEIKLTSSRYKFIYHVRIVYAADER